MSHNSGSSRETDQKKKAIKFALEEEREWKNYKEINKYRLYSRILK